MNAPRIAWVSSMTSSLTRVVASAMVPVKQWYSGLQAREQFLVSRGAVAATALLLVGGLLQLHAAVSKAQAAVVRAWRPPAQAPAQRRAALAASAPRPRFRRLPQWRRVGAPSRRTPWAICPSRGRPRCPPRRWRSATPFQWQACASIFVLCGTATPLCAF